MLMSLDRAVTVVGIGTRRLMLPTGRGPLRPVWRFAYAAFIRAAAVALRLASADAVYLRGSFAVGDPIYGLSDVDLIAITERESSRHRAPGRLRKHVARLYKVLPAAKNVVELTVFEGGELERELLSPGLTYPYDPVLCAPVPRARFYGGRRSAVPFGPRPDASARLYGPLRSWRLVAGRDYAAGVAASPPEYRWLWTWQDLQFFWRHAPRRAVNPGSAHARYFCTKMAAEPSRLWLWLNGEHPADRNLDVLEQALAAVPEERETLEHAIRVVRSLPAAGAAPLHEMLGFLYRMTCRIGELVAAEACLAGTTDVRLSGSFAELEPGGDGGPRIAALASDGGDPVVVPLVDWRARLGLGPPEETLVLLPGDPADPERLAALARAADDEPGAVPALRSGDVLVLPSAKTGLVPFAARSFRAVQCPASDPVSFALLDGVRQAAFPNLPGWSAAECAERAVLEHRAWLDVEDEQEQSRRRQLGMLFGAVRAAVFHESLQAGDPELPLTFAEVAERLGAADGTRADAVHSALGEYRSSRCGGGEPSADAVAPLRALVRSLASYGGSLRLS